MSHTVIKDPISGGLTNCFGVSDTEVKQAANDAQRKVQATDSDALARQEAFDAAVAQAVQRAYEAGVRAGSTQQQLKEPLSQEELQGAEREAFADVASSADLLPGYHPDEELENSPVFSPLAIPTPVQPSPQAEVFVPDEPPGEPGDPGTADPAVVAVIGDRAARILAQAGYATLAELDAATDQQLLAVEKIGQQTVDRIRNRGVGQPAAV